MGVRRERRDRRAPWMVGAGLVVVAPVAMLAWGAAGVGASHGLAPGSGAPTVVGSDVERMAPLADAPASLPSPGASEPAALGRAGEAWMPVRLMGRVVDDQGAAVAGALLAVLPDGRIPGTPDGYAELLEGDLAAWQTVIDPRDHILGRSGDDGRFTLDTSLRRPPGDDEQAWPAARPWLWVWHPDHVAADQSCDWLPQEGGDHDVGEIELPAAVAIVGRCVDAFGRPLAGVQLGADVDAAASECPDDPGHRFFAFGFEGAASAMVGIGPEDRLAMAVSDASGRFELRGAEPGDPTRVWAGGAGWLPWRSGLLRPAAGRPHDLGDIVMTTAGAVSGRVVDDGGRPIAGAQVRGRPLLGGRSSAWDGDVDPHTLWRAVVDGDPPEGVAEDERLRRAAVELVDVTDAQGRFTLVGLCDTPITVHADALEWEPARVGPVVRDQRDVKLVLQPAPARDIVLMDPDGQPLVASSVRVQDEDDLMVVMRAWESGEPLPAGLSAVDPEAGLWRLDEACDHALSLKVSIEDRGTTTVTVDDPSEAPRDRPLVVPVTPRRRLRGRALDERGDVLGKVAVEAFAADGRSLESFRLPADGRIERHVPGDAVVLTLHKASHFARIELPPRGDVELGDVVLPASPHVTVTVLDAAGLPVPRAKLTVSEPREGGWGQLRWQRTGDDGVARLSWRRAGLRRVTVAYPGGDRVADPVELDGEPRDVALVMRARPPCRLSGRVTRAGRPVPGAEVNWHPGGKTTTDADGRFGAEVQPGRTLKVWAREGDAYSPSQEFETTEDGRRELELAFGEAVAEGRLSGDLTVPGGAQVTWQVKASCEGRRSREVDSPDGSTFRIADLEPGTWLLQASLRWGGGRLELGRVEAELPGPPVSLPVSAPARVTVRLWDRPGCPATADVYEVRVLDDQDRAQQLSVGSGCLLAPGAHRLVVTPALRPWRPETALILEHVLVEQELRLAAGEQREIDLLVPR